MLLRGTVIWLQPHYQVGLCLSHRTSAAPLTNTSGALRSQASLASCCASPPVNDFHPRWCKTAALPSGVRCEFPGKDEQRGERENLLSEFKTSFSFYGRLLQYASSSISLAKPMLNAIPKESGESFVKNQMCLIWFIYNKSETTCVYRPVTFGREIAHTCVITTPIKMEKFPPCWSNINWSLGHFE